MKTKVAFMTLYPAPSRKANAVSIMNTCSQLAALGLDLELIVPRPEKSHSRRLLNGRSIWDFYAVPHNFKVTYLPSASFLFHPAYLGYTLLATSYAVAKGKSLVHSRHIELAYAAALSKKMAVFESHSYLKSKDHPLLPHWIRMMRNPERPVGMVVTTHAGASAYRSRGVPPNRILVAPNGVDVERFVRQERSGTAEKCLSLPRNKAVVGFCGHLYEGRGIEQLLDCARMLCQVFFLIVGGEREDVLKYSCLARRLKLQNVEFSGFVPQSTVPSYLLSCDILVMPYTTETFSYEFISPVKMFDYLAAGRPIVATDLPIVREVLQDRKNAILVPPGSGEALASGIEYVLKHPEDAAKLGKQARQDAEMYSWKKRAKTIFDWMHELFNI